MIRFSPRWTMLAAGLLLGCNGEPTGSFTATLEGPLEGTVHGNALFCRPAGEEGVRLVLRDPESAAGFLLGHASPEPPTAGAYGVVDDPEAQTGATFWLEPELGALEGGDEYAYRVRGGTLRLLSVDPSWVKGRFEVELVASDTSLEVDPATRSVRYLPTRKMPVKGRFSAARVEVCPAAEAP